MDESASDDILARAAISDADAFAMLYRRHLHRVYSYVLSRVGNVQDAQDLTTQTFMAALQSLGTYRPQASFSAWLLGIARYKAIDYLRSKQPTLPLDDDFPLVDASPPPDEIIGQRWQMQEISGLLHKLNPDRAEALRLRYFGDLKFREIALVMERSEGSVKMLVARALDDLRRMLQVQENTR